MDARDALHYATILCLDVPEGTEFGIDKHCWRAGPKFKGVKLIPPGLHYVFYSATNKYGGDSAPRSSFFVILKPGDVLVKKWNPKEETLDEVGEDEAERYAAGVRRFEFDQFLGAFPFSNESEIRHWSCLTCFITPKLLQKVEPVNHIISTSAPAPDSNNKAQEFKGGVPYFCEIPKRVSSSLETDKTKLSPAEITKLNMDKSAVLEHIIKKEFDGDENMLLGELQFSFITFLLGQSYEGFEHWKDIVVMLCSCEESLKKRPDFFRNFARTLYHQLKEVPDDFFVDIISGKNFLTQALKSFFELTSDNELDPGLKKTAKKLRQSAEERFGVSFSIEDLYGDDEDAPTVVNEL